MITVQKTYQHRDYTSRAGFRRNEQVLRESDVLCNAALEEWRCAYRVGVSVSLYNQYRELTAIRAGDEFWNGLSVQSCLRYVYACYDYHKPASICIMPLCSTLADVGIAPLYPFGATSATGGVTYCLSVQPRTCAWLTRWTDDAPPRPTHRLACLKGIFNIQVDNAGDKAHE